VADDVPTAAPQPETPRHLGAGAALTVLASLGPLAAAAVLSVVLARAIGPAANGTFALVLTLVNVAVLVFSFGLSSGITYEVSQGRWPLDRAFREAYLAALLLGAGGAAAGLGFYALTDDSALRAVDLDLALIALAGIPGFLAWQFATGILLGRDRYEGYAALQLTSSLVMLIVGAGLALPFGLTGAVVGLAASGIVTACVGAWLLARTIRSSPDPPAAMREGGLAHLRRAFPFGVQSWVGNVLQQANYRLDLLILGAYAAASELGKYSVAVTLTSIGWLLPNGLQTVVFPRAARLDAAAETGTLTAAESDEAVSRASRHSVLLIVPAGAVVAVLLAAVPLIWGAEFEETIGLGFVLLPGVLALGVGKVLSAIVTGRGKPRYMMYAGILGATATVTMYFLLIPAYDEWGAAAASSASYLLSTVIVWGFFRRTTGISARAALLPTRADVRNYREALDSLRAPRRARR
jgi:O-antigen/teichoic acid export membrane protein